MLLRVIGAKALREVERAEGYVFTTAMNVLRDYWRRVHRSPAPGRVHRRQPE